MAKTPKLKKRSKRDSPRIPILALSTPILKLTSHTAPSLHSRAFKRGPSPPSLHSTHTNPPPSALSAHLHHGAGISKKRPAPRKSKASMSRQQRQRHQKGMQRAEAVLDMRAKKREREKGGGRERRVPWEELNVRIAPSRSRDKRKHGKGLEDVDDSLDGNGEHAGVEEDGLPVEGHGGHGLVVEGGGITNVEPDGEHGLVIAEAGELEDDLIL